MTRVYPNKKVIYTKVLEKLSYLILFPLIIKQTSKKVQVKNILLIEPFQMGDIVSLTPLINPLRKKFPGCTISFLTKPSSGAFLRYDSRVNNIYTIDFPWADHGEKKNNILSLLKVIKYVYTLRKFKFDLGIDTRGDIRSQIIMVLSGCKKRIGYLNYLHSNIQVSGNLLTEKMRETKFWHRYEWNIYILKLLGFEEQELLPLSFPSFFPDQLPNTYEPNVKTILIHIGAGWRFKCWNESKWVELINYLEKSYQDQIVLIGGNGEKEALMRIKSKLVKSNKIEIKITSLDELIMQINQSSQFICLDSGPMNLAVCLNKKCIALFGPGEIFMWRPIHEKGKFIQKIEKFPCSPCLQKTCFYPRKNCMDEIEVEDVIKALT